MRALPILLAALPVPGGGAEVLSLDSEGAPPESGSYLGSTGRVRSADGRFVVFESAAADLAPLDANEVGDVFLRDRLLGRTRRLSSTPGGAAGSGVSAGGTIAADGSRVAFSSRADDLGPDATGDRFQVWVWDAADDTLSLASRAPAGGPASGDCYFPAFSADGERLAFWSDAPDLVPGDANGRGDIFVLELGSGALERVNLRPGGAESPDGALPILDLSGDGGTVAFVAQDAALVGAEPFASPQAFAVDLASGVTELISVDADGVPADGLVRDVSLARDGRVVLFDTAAALAPEDENGAVDVWLRDRALQTTECLSVQAEGVPAGGFGGRLSPNARFAAYSAREGPVPDPIQLFLRDRAERRTERLSTVAGAAADGDTFGADPSNDGTEVVCVTAAEGLAPGGSDGADVVALTRSAPERTVLCLGDGSGEAECPCGLSAGAGEGCGNHAGVGARLTARSVPVGVRLDYVQGFVGGTAVLVAGNGLDAGLPFQAGLFCAGTEATRVGVAFPGDTGAARWIRAAPPPGATRVLQVWYRDGANPCAGPGNLSNAVRVSADGIGR